MTQLIVNHLWQSSCFALLAGLLAFVLRKNSPKVRYWVWLSASLKFFIPFALLMNLGSVIPRPTRQEASVPVPVFTKTLVEIAAPLSATAYEVSPTHSTPYWVPATIAMAWTLGFFAITLARCRSWMGVRAAVRAGTPIELPIPVRALVTPSAEEPGVVGFLRPVLVLPAQLFEHLNPRQVDAILTHEMCHVRRRDNFFAAMHMAVEAIFWFHPFVWWIGSRMLHERELACDEEVLRMGCEPTDYVEGILKVCRFYTESPLPCVSGVTGADVKERLRAILAGTIAYELNAVKRVSLAVIGLAALVVPILIGVLNAPAIRAQDAPAFEVASIKKSSGDILWTRPQRTPGRFRWTTQLAYLVGYAYSLDFSRVSGMHLGDIYTIDAAFKPEATEGQVRLMLQSLLLDRFKMRVHRTTSELEGYAITVARGGIKMKEVEADGERASRPAFCKDVDDHGGWAWGTLPATGVEAVTGCRASILQLATVLARSNAMPVWDKTGLVGSYDFTFRYSRDISPDVQADAPSLGAALQEDLGLTLQKGKGPSETLVVDHIEPLIEN